MNNVKFFVITSLAFITLGCAQAAHLTVNNNDTYTLTKRSRTALGRGDDLIYELYAESKSYCEKQGKEMVPIDETSSNGILYVDFAHAQLSFSCK